MNESINIEPYKAQELIIRETVEQVKKDFSMFGLDIDFPIDFQMVYDDLWKNINVHINRLLSQNPQKLSALLYQVDISEADLAKASEKYTDFTRVDIITELLIYRELKKVIYRNYYKSLKNKDISL